MEDQAGPFAWMAWTPVVAVFFAALGLVLVGIGSEARFPSARAELNTQAFERPL